MTPSREELLADELERASIIESDDDEPIELTSRLLTPAERDMVVVALRGSAQALPPEPRRIEVDIGAAAEALQNSPELCAMMNEMVGGPALVEAQAEIERLNGIIAALPASSGEVRTDDLPAIPDDNSDFTPELARKIVAQYQRIVRALPHQPDVREAVRSNAMTTPPPSPAPDAVRLALADARAALSALKLAVEASGKMNGREYVSLGIQVNNALDSADIALTQKALQAAPADGVREATIEECAKVAKAHKGAARKKRQGKGKLYYGSKAMEEILAEERGEDIASEIIEREIRALKSPSVAVQPVGEPKK